MLEALAKMIKVLNSETEPWQISLAACLAMIAGFSPLASAHNLLVLLAVLVLKVNLSTFIVAWTLFGALAFALDPLFHRIGLGLLTFPGLAGFWTALYNTTWFRLDRLYNTVVLGSLVTALVLFIPLFFLANWLIRRYRTNIRDWVGKLKIAQAIKASKLFAIYQNLPNLGGAG